MGSIDKSSLKITPETILQRNDNHISSTIDEEVVILNIDKGMYFNLNEIGTFIWDILENPCNFESLIAQLVEEYGVNMQDCINDTEPFLLELIANQIIYVAHE